MEKKETSFTANIPDIKDFKYKLVMLKNPDATYYGDFILTYNNVLCSDIKRPLFYIQTEDNIKIYFYGSNINGNMERCMYLYYSKKYSDIVDYYFVFSANKALNLKKHILSIIISNM